MKRKNKTKALNKILLALLLMVFVSFSTITFAWFTDKKDYASELTFGSIELDVSGGVSGDGIDAETSKITFDVARTGVAYSGKVMPGDTININLTLGLKTGSDPAYYLIFITDDNGVFANAVYFSQDGTNVYVNDGTKTYLQSDSTKTAVADKYCGKLTTASSQSIQIGAKVSEDYTEQNTTANITCQVKAIQQANLTEQEAYEKLYTGSASDEPTGTVNFVSADDLKAVITNYKKVTSIGFYNKEEATTLGYSKDDTLTTNLDAKLAESDQGNLEVWKTSDTDIAFVSDKVIMAPENCAYLFGGASVLNKFGKLKTVEFNNFNTSGVTDMSNMFYYCTALTTLNLSNFNTSSVTNMSSMFEVCSALTTLNVSNFNTSSVTSMSWMFAQCIDLITLNASNFNTSSVTNMEYMFGGCSALTTLDLSNFNTSSVTNMGGMFGNTFSDSPSTSTLKISSNFTYQNDSGVATQFDSKATLNSETGLDTSVTVLKDGATLS